jgi:FkbM family methyltransferase
LYNERVAQFFAENSHGMNAYASTTLTLGPATRQLFFRKGTSDEHVIKQIFVDQHYNLGRCGERAKEILDLVKRQEAAGRKPLIVDAGANIGASAIYFAGLLPGVHVVAIEPDRENFELMSKNIEGLGGIQAIRGAIASTAGRARVIDPGRSHWAYRTEPAGESDQARDVVPRVTMNDIYAAHRSGYYPFIAKIDIEGAEQDLFSANTEWVSQTAIVIVELHDWMLPKARTSQPFLQCISQLDRDFICHGEETYSIANDLTDIATS